MMLVTGHKGFVGGYLTQAFPDLVGYDFGDGNDIVDEAKLKPLFKEYKFESVVNLAARAGVRGGTRNPEEYIHTNVSGTRALLSLSEQYGVKHFVHFSSSSVYGNQNPPNGEDVPYAPTSLYGVTKAASEMLCRISPVPTTVIRPFTLYGKNGRADQVVYTWLNCYRDGKPAPFFGEGRSRRGYTHVADVIDGLALILKEGPPESGHQTFNLGGAEVITLEQLAQIFKEELPDIVFDRQPMPSSDVFENWADTSKAERELGWKPQRNFDDEMRSIIRSFKETR